MDNNRGAAHIMVSGPALLLLCSKIHLLLQTQISICCYKHQPTHVHCAAFFLRLSIESNRDGPHGSGSPVAQAETVSVAQAR